MNQRLHDLLGGIEVLLEHLNGQHLSPEMLGLHCAAPMWIHEAWLFLEEARAVGDRGGVRLIARAERIFEALNEVKDQLQAPPVAFSGSSLSA